MFKVSFFSSSDVVWDCVCVVSVSYYFADFIQFPSVFGLLTTPRPNKRRGLMHGPLNTILLAIFANKIRRETNGISDLRFIKIVYVRPCLYDWLFTRIFLPPPPREFALMMNGFNISWQPCYIESYEDLCGLPDRGRLWPALEVKIKSTTTPPQPLVWTKERTPLITTSAGFK